MDTSVLPNETNVPNELHVELEQSAFKLEKRDNRNEANVGFGATTEGMAITKTYLNQVTAGVTEKLSGPRPSSNSAEFKLERLLRQLDPEVLALCILQSGLHVAGRRGSRDVVAAEIAIGRAINDELWAQKLLQTEAGPQDQQAGQGTLRLRRAAQGSRQASR